jgi:hypothetical protein
MYEALLGVKVLELQVIDAVVLHLGVDLVGLGASEDLHHTLLVVELQQRVDHLLVLLQTLRDSLRGVVRALHQGFSRFVVAALHLWGVKIVAVSATAGSVYPPLSNSLCAQPCQLQGNINKDRCA